MTLDTSREDLVQAVLEGVAFAVRDNLEVARSLGLTLTSSKLCGGGAKSQLWQKILANVLDISLELPQTEQGPGYGGAMLAMVACGRFPSVQEAAKALTRSKAVVEPEPALVSCYEQRYQQFREIYPTLRGLFPKLQEG
jgi:xylulokinase